MQRPDGKILLLSRTKQSRNRPGELDFPGGKVEPGEDFTDALCREIFEETSIKVKRCDARLTFTITQMEPFGNCCKLYYLALVPDQPVILSDYEHDAFQWIDLDAAIDLHKHPSQRSFLRYLRDNQLLR